jgi:putative lipoprotein
VRIDLEGRREPPFSFPGPAGREVPLDAMRRALTVLVAALLVAGCAPGRDRPPSAEITGTVTSRERIVLLPDTELRVTLSEASRADGPARFIAETTIPGVTKVPVAFRLMYDPAWIDPQLVYTLTARLERDGRLLFINDAVMPVLTRGAPPRVEIVVVSASGRR